MLTKSQAISSYKQNQQLEYKEMIRQKKSKEKANRVIYYKDYEDLVRIFLLSNNKLNTEEEKEEMKEVLY